MTEKRLDKTVIGSASEPETKRSRFSDLLLTRSLIWPICFLFFALLLLAAHTFWRRRRHPPDHIITSHRCGKSSGGGRQSNEVPRKSANETRPHPTEQQWQ